MSILGLLDGCSRAHHTMRHLQRVPTVVDRQHGSSGEMADLLVAQLSIPPRLAEPQAHASIDGGVLPQEVAELPHGRDVADTHVKGDVLEIVHVQGDKVRAREDGFLHADAMRGFKFGASLREEGRHDLDFVRGREPGRLGGVTGEPAWSVSPVFTVVAIRGREVGGRLKR